MDLLGDMSDADWLALVPLASHEVVQCQMLLLTVAQESNMWLPNHATRTELLECASCAYNDMNA